MKLDASIVRLLRDHSLLKRHIVGVLDRYGRGRPGDMAPNPDPRAISAVLFLLGHGNCRPDPEAGPCLVLNKRSGKVKQPGDLCCPGGGINQRTDRILARLLHLPRSPLRRWPAWALWQRRNSGSARQLALLLAASLREGLEEMRLNPFGLDFLGPMPSQRLVMFKREIYPLVSWINHQKRFYPNWEVERVVYIPLNELLDPERYARYRIEIETKAGRVPYDRDFPCFVHRRNGDSEVLWGATYRITMVFLSLVFGFSPPDRATLPTVRGTLDETYFAGNG